MLITSNYFEFDQYSKSYLHCKTKHYADKTGALFRKFAFRANMAACFPTVCGGDFSLNFCIGG